MTEGEFVDRVKALAAKRNALIMGWSPSADAAFEWDATRGNAVAIGVLVGRLERAEARIADLEQQLREDAP